MKKIIKNFKVPYEVPKELITRKAEFQYSYSYADAYSAKVQNGILQLNLYSVKKEGISFYATTFIGNEDYITVKSDYAISTATLERLSYYHLKYITDEDKKAVEAFLISNNFEIKSDDPYDSLVKFQQKLFEKKKAKKYKRERERLDNELKGIKKVPKGFTEFCKNGLWKDKHFLYFSTEERAGTCTKCHEKVPVPKGYARQGVNCKCPSCKNEVTAINTKFRNKEAYDTRAALLFQKKGKEEFIIRYFNVSRNMYGNILEPEFEIKEVVRTVFNKNSCKTYEYYDFHGLGYDWKPFMEHYGFIKATPYKGNLKTEVKKSIFEYSALELYVKAEERKLIKRQEPTFGSPYPNGWGAENYLETYQRIPGVEYMLKLGFYNLASAQLFGTRSTYNRPTWGSGHNIKSILKVNKYGFDILKELGNPTPKDLQVCQAVAHWESREKVRAFYDNRKLYLDSLNDAVKVCDNYMTFHKMCRYIKEHVEEYADERDKFKHTTIQYFDYLNACITLEYDMKNTMILFPKHLKEAHDREALNIKIGKNKLDIALTNALLPLMHKRWDYKSDGFVIKAPDDGSQIIEEGHILHHCVAGYLHTVAKGGTTILFCRKENEIDKPFITVEVDNNNHLRQAHGYKNAPPPQEVLDFLEKFKKAKKVS